MVRKVHCCQHSSHPGSSTKQWITRWWWLLRQVTPLRCNILPFAGAAIGEYFRDTGRHGGNDDLSKQAVFTVRYHWFFAARGSWGVSGRYLLPALSFAERAAKIINQQEVALPDEWLARKPWKTRGWSPLWFNNGFAYHWNTGGRRRLYIPTNVIPLPTDRFSLRRTL